uniref:Uncharacterized protein n=1 Tax=Glossina austeni TaxID=7395 RepID=A0A1A9V569_GLOAU
MDTHRHKAEVEKNLLTQIIGIKEYGKELANKAKNLDRIAQMNLDNNKRGNDLAARLLQFNNCTKVKEDNTEDLRFFNANMADNHLIQHKTQNLLNAVCKRQEIIS